MMSNLKMDVSRCKKITERRSAQCALNDWLLASVRISSHNMSFCYYHYYHSINQSINQNTLT